MHITEMTQMDPTLFVKTTRLIIHAFMECLDKYIYERQQSDQFLG